MILAPILIEGPHGFLGLEHILINRWTGIYFPVIGAFCHSAGIELQFDLWKIQSFVLLLSA
jgi:hypothetical protein